MIANKVPAILKWVGVFLVAALIYYFSSYISLKYGIGLPVNDKLAFLIMGALIAFTGTRVYYRKKLGLE